MMLRNDKNDEPESIWDLKMPDGSPRFYPFFKHPASAEARKALKDLEEWETLHVETVESRAYKAYLMRQIEAVELPEAQARAVAEARLREAGR